ncbi:hypothetical protein CLAFUW4_00052 [Fulvia fulva]|uniref:Uncharacterized protein n=1 Tax=Passalora fulva TaxID=5499 RepID=A0A9Q8L830_PASFU|nr:uncharacterized protein CLAFUR5_00050 [Fulvia fulva]KAK4634499.1 hypothetical protein CLAFUR4_00051 [Fulvia fulva]KAK4636725.1 hypothetical protein CLAFUR0_00050 [Fulvia fulva]UJO12635.1 hypothetical protein CLAFUR5_00050 [Fulvia fulva]WPV08290.1 hypothetical protein CLAFUW4_00052 [Fulvia fulva]WPV24642.1 hypothetical protein CLAFUW7_00052 [Fulvia fulva]
MPSSIVQPYRTRYTTMERQLYSSGDTGGRTHEGYTTWSTTTGQQHATHDLIRAQAIMPAYAGAAATPTSHYSFPPQRSSLYRRCPECPEGRRWLDRLHCLQPSNMVVEGVKKLWHDGASTSRACEKPGQWKRKHK